MNKETTLTVISNKKTERIARNLSVLIKNSGLPLTDLAEQLNLPVMTIRRLMSGSTSNPTISTLKLFADKFNVTIDALLDGDIENQKDDNNKSNFKPMFVPVLDWTTAERINNIRELNLDSWTEWQPLSLGQDKISELSFALKSRPSMYPRYSSGTIFIIDPNIEASDGDTILLRIKTNSELTLRSLTIDPPDWDLHSIIADSKSFKFSKSDHEIIGVVMVTLLFNKKLILQSKG